MPRGIPNPKPVPPPPTLPTPMILIEPAVDGAIRFNAYGLDQAEMVNLLRRCLLHVVATASGVQVISLDVPANGAVVVSKAPSKPKLSSRPVRNGRGAQIGIMATAESEESDDW